MAGMELETTTVVMGIGGAVILYGAITNRNPIDVIKLTLQGRPITEARPIANFAGNNPFVEVVQGTASADPREMHSDGTPRLFPDGSPRYINDPKPQDLPANDPRRRFRPVPAPGQPGDPRPPVDARR